MRADILALSLLAFLASMPHGLRAETAAAASEAAPEPQAAQVLPAISVATVSRETLRDRVIISGLIGAVERVQVAPLIEGQPIEALLADVGDVVNAGDVLATLSASTLELQLSQSKASIASARATIARSSTTWSTTTSPWESGSKAVRH